MLNKHQDVLTPGAVYVGRGSSYGNPFSHLPSQYPEVIRVETRETAVAMYTAWVMGQGDAFIARVQRELRGRDLVCYCAPLACHADLLLTIANDHHVWSGWPGAWCLDCGVEDQHEICVNEHDEGLICQCGKHALDCGELNAPTPTHNLIGCKVHVNTSCSAPGAHRHNPYPATFYRCPVCGAVSSNANDIAQRFCGACKILDC